MKTLSGREISPFIEGYGEVKPYQGPFAYFGDVVKTEAKLHAHTPNESKLVASIEEVIDKVGLKDGMTVSFHHHLRNGDKVTNMVMAAIAKKGFKNIHVAASGLFACHEPLVQLMKDEVITKVTTSTFNKGPVADAITHGALKYPVTLQSHGGRPRAIESGDLHIDVAFIASPSCDAWGNINGSHGPSACGYLSYIMADAEYADHVVAITDNLVPYPNSPIEINQSQVEYIVKVDSIGDPNGIVSGTTKITTDPVRLKIASDTAKLIDKAGYIKDGFSFQTGAGGTSLAVAAEVREIMKERSIVGSFGAGGIHAYFIQMLEEGLFRGLFDVQCFDLEAVRSSRENANHMQMSGSLYANPFNRCCVVNNLDVVILGATEIDTKFNVNVVTGSTGTIMGASGGHSDCAAGSKLCIVVSNLLLKGKYCILRDDVTTITTPGETVDAFVTDFGIAINPNRKDLIAALKDSDLPIVDINELKRIGEEKGEALASAELTDRVIGVVEYRDGSVVDLVYMPKA